MVVEENYFLSRVEERGDWIELSFLEQDVIINLPRESIDFDRMKALEGRQVRVIGEMLPPTRTEDILEIVYCLEERPERLYKRSSK